jgi:deoxycytidylate deaminase
MEPAAAARIATALVYKREIISTGICQMKSHPFQKTYAKNSKAIFLHAEVDAIKNAVNQRIDLDIIAKSTLYICRQRIIAQEWTAGIARPCSGCERCIAAFGINQVVFSLDDYGYGVLN